MQSVYRLTTVALLLVSLAMVCPGDIVVAQRADTRSLELILKWSSLENVDDKAGRWQFEAGEVFKDGKHVANYASTKRVVFNQSLDTQNTAMHTVTIFFLGKAPPENITLQGSHDFSSGNQIGSVSATAGQYSSLIGKKFSGTGDKVTIK